MEITFFAMRKPAMTLKDITLIDWILHPFPHYWLYQDAPATLSQNRILIIINVLCVTNWLRDQQ